MKPSLSLLLACLLLAGCARAHAPADPAASAAGSADGSAATSSAAAASAAAQPAPTASVVAQALAATGITIEGSLDAPQGYHGYLGSYQGRPLPVYVGPDGRHVLVGSLFDLQGHDLTSPALTKLAKAGSAEQWQQLEKASWFVEGNPNATRVVYAFMDTECPYCHEFWQDSQKWLQSGNVQMRIILVAVIKAESLPRGAAVLAAKDPAAAWAENEREFKPGRPAPAGTPAPDAVRTLGAHNQLMQTLGFQGTPSIIYKDAAGAVHALQGMPRDADALRAIFEG